jgi:hypothetical protein
MISPKRDHPKQAARDQAIYRTDKAATNCSNSNSGNCAMPEQDRPAAAQDQIAGHSEDKRGA